MLKNSPRMQKFTVIAQDPAVKSGGRILTAQVEIPAEVLGPGPGGHRVQVIDYDASSDKFYRPLTYTEVAGGLMEDPFNPKKKNKKGTRVDLRASAQFHAQNVFAIVMRILARFEHALGRRVAWSFGGHQVKVAPHAFADANAFYSRRDEGIFFGYFAGSEKGKTIYTCLSHDIIAHETTHGLLDGLREHYMDPSSPDQAAFHEGFADVVALLSVFAMPEVVRKLINDGSADETRKPGWLPAEEKMRKQLRSIAGALFTMGEEMGSELYGVRGQALRASALLEVKPENYTKTGDSEFLEPHRRGEILVAAMLAAFSAVWAARLSKLNVKLDSPSGRELMAEKGIKAADRMLTIAIRALDYCPPVHITFRDFLTALLTADVEMYPDDELYGFRACLRQAFERYGIKPASRARRPEPGVWTRSGSRKERALDYSRCHPAALEHDPTEMARFIWENRKPLELMDGADTKVLTVSPCWRVGIDGFHLRETVAQYVQTLRLRASELDEIRIDKPKGMSPETEIALHGGGVLVFDEHGQVKYHIHNRLNSPEKQSGRIAHLFRQGFYDPEFASQRRFAQMHRRRMFGRPVDSRERW